MFNNSCEDTTIFSDEFRGPVSDITKSLNVRIKFLLGLQMSCF
jgi:hypothetical protein